MANKPINELALSRDTFASISDFKGYVFLTPVVLRHQVFSADVNLDFSNLKSTISVIQDQPENRQAPDLEAIQTLSAMSAVSFYGSIDLEDLVRKKLEVYLSAASIQGGEIQDLTNDGKENLFTFAKSRSLYKKPVKLGVKSEMFFVYNEAVEADFNMTYDQEYKGSLMSIKLSYAPNKNMDFNAGADIIGVEGESEDTSNFLSKNQANDRMFLGARYAF
jgi:hypothetical protein